MAKFVRSRNQPRGRKSTRRYTYGDRAWDGHKRVVVLMPILHNVPAYRVVPVELGHKHSYVVDGWMLSDEPGPGFEEKLRAGVGAPVEEDGDDLEYLHVSLDVVGSVKVKYKHAGKLEPLHHPKDEDQATPCATQ